MPIIGTLPNNIQNGQAVDATPVMADFNFIVNQVNANGNPTGTLTAPSGTRVVFNQAAAPVGWTLDTLMTDHTIQLVGNGTSGGNFTSGIGYSSMFLNQWTSDGHALTTAELAVHSHTDAGHAHAITDPSHFHNSNGALSFAGAGNNLQGGATTAGAVNTQPATTGISINTGFANIQNTGSGTAHSHTKTFNVNYATCCICTKT